LDLGGVAHQGIASVTLVGRPKRLPSPEWFGT
jgi:hypothetical protein